MEDFTSLFDFLPIGAYRTRPDGTQIRANPALVRLNGYDSEAELLEGVRDIAREWYVDPGRRAEFTAALERDGYVRGFVSEIWRHKTRERIWISENAHLVRAPDGTILYYEGTVEEITDRVRAAEAVARSERSFRQIADHVPGLVYRLEVRPGHRPRFTFVSEGARELLGCTPADLMADPMLPHRLRHPQDRPRVAAEVQSANRTRGRLFSEHRLVLPDGRLKWVQLASSAETVEPDGTSLRIGVMIDVTDRHARDDLQRQRDQAEAAVRAKTEFLSRVSHELRTPMNAVLGFAQLLQMSNVLRDREAAWLEQILASGRHLLGLLDDLLDLSGAQAGRLAVNLDAVDLDPVLESALAMATAAVPAYTGPVRVDRPPAGLPPIRADARRLTQVLVNLLTNAMKYGGLQGAVDVRLFVGEDTVGVEVRDHGQGLSPDQLARLFQPFERLGQESGHIPGTGLGLALSRHLVEQMGGTLEAASAGSAGARFTVRLPTAASDARARAAAPEERGARPFQASSAGGVGI
jgi:PAS domain S-box-containing protein